MRENFLGVCLSISLSHKTHTTAFIVVIIILTFLYFSFLLNKLAPICQCSHIINHEICVGSDTDSSFENLARTLYIYIGPAVRVFANGPGDLGSIPGRVIPKTLKMELDTTLLNTQHYKVRFKGKVEQSWEWSSALPYTLV